MVVVNPVQEMLCQHNQSHDGGVFLAVRLAKTLGERPAATVRLTPRRPVDKVHRAKGSTKSEDGEKTRVVR